MINEKPVPEKERVPAYGGGTPSTDGPLKARTASSGIDALKPLGVSVVNEVDGLDFNNGTRPSSCSLERSAFKGGGFVRVKDFNKGNNATTIKDANVDAVLVRTALSNSGCGGGATNDVKGRTATVAIRRNKKMRVAGYDRDPFLGGSVDKGLVAAKASTLGGKMRKVGGELGAAVHDKGRGALKAGITSFANREGCKRNLLRFSIKRTGGLDHDARVI